uniref:Uncharacterized protein n=1 Tax=Ascaris lumbricoides TaxID=6252 RepID=A0A0M3IIH7_ASCLU
MKLEKLQDEISARLHSYRLMPFFVISTVLCTLVLMTGIILIQASNIVKSKYNCRKSHERFRKLWAEETAKDEAASCVADIDFTYADARPGLICRLHPTQLDGKLIFFGMCAYHLKNSFEMIGKFCEEDLRFCQQSRFTGQYFCFSFFFFRSVFIAIGKYLHSIWIT